MKQFVQPILNVCLLCLLLCSESAFSQFQSVSLPVTEARAQSVLAIKGQVYLFTLHLDGTRTYERFSQASGFMQSDFRKPLGEDVIFVDTANINGEQRILLIGRHSARYLDEDGNPGTQIINFNAMYKVPVRDDIPVLDLFRDINHDGLDDLVMPSFDGYEIGIQQEKGRFSQILDIDAKPMMDISYRNHPWYQAKHLFLADMNQDKRDDIVFWEAGEFVIYPQLPSAEFSNSPVRLQSPVALDYDSVDAMSVSFSEEDQSDRTARVVYAIEDFNSDDIVDLLKMTVRSSGVFNKKTTFSLHQGVQGDAESGGITGFDPVAKSSIESSGIQYETELKDLNQDGHLDMVVSSVELGVGKIIAALLTSSIKIELAFYEMQDGLYGKKPNTTRDITATFSLSSGEVSQPTMMLLDVNGDGLQDLLLQADKDELDIFYGEASERLFARKPIKVDIQLPNDPEFVTSGFINDDQLPDIIIRLPPPLESKSTLHQVKLLLSTLPVK